MKEIIKTPLKKNERSLTDVLFEGVGQCVG